MDEGPIASCFPVKESQDQRGTRGIAQAHIYEVNLPWELRLHLLQMANKHLPESWSFSFNALSLAELRILMWREIQLLHRGAINCRIWARLLLNLNTRLERSIREPSEITSLKTHLWGMCSQKSGNSLGGNSFQIKHSISVLSFGVWTAVKPGPLISSSHEHEKHPRHIIQTPGKVEGISRQGHRAHERP